MAEAADSQNQITGDPCLLYRLCCKAEFSKQHWRRRLQKSDSMNTTDSYRGMLPDTIKGKALYSGSESEGVAMDILGSDIDVMYVLLGTHVIEDDEISSVESENVFKMILTTHPAFVNTELRHRGETADSGVMETPKWCDLDDTGRHLLNSERLQMSLMKDRSILHGPAMTSKLGDNKEIDWVVSLHCRSWPSVSREWIDRPREYNWPTPDQIKEIVDNGCELVCLGAPNSASPHFDFRLSSSLAEKILVRSFNIYQIQCYFLLKVILKFRIKPFFSIETLCSYHMKTIMLYVVETTDPVVWREDNLVYCFMMCLQKLQSCLRDGNCPQYFIPQQNLFERKVKLQLKEIMEIVNDIVADDWSSVLRFPPFNKLEDCHHLDPRCLCGKNRRDWDIFNPLARICHNTFSGYIVINDMCDVSLQSCIKMLQHMCSFKVEHESKYFPCKYTVLVYRSLFKSIIGLSLLNRVTRRQDRDHVERLVLQYAEQCMESACESSLVSCRLKYAIFLYVNKETEKCVELVKEYVTTHSDVLPICVDMARAKGPLSNLLHCTIFHIIAFYLDAVRDAYKRFIPPVCLSKWELKACPLIIQNVAEIRQLVTEHDHKHPSVLMIDPLVCACVLLVLAYTDLGRCQESIHSLEMLRQCAENHKQCSIFYPDIARLLLEQCQQYVSSGSQQDLSPSNLLAEGCLFTHRNNVFLQLWKLTTIYNQALLKNGVKPQFTSPHPLQLE